MTPACVTFGTTVGSEVAISYRLAEFDPAALRGRQRLTCTPADRLTIMLCYQGQCADSQCIGVWHVGRYELNIAIS
jgi:hypothetical protein